MSGCRNALVIGGGLGGMAAVLSLREIGIAVDLVEVDAAWRAYGAGITITGPTYRALRRLGLAEAALREGFGGAGLLLRAADGTILHEATLPNVDGLPGVGGILRPVLHRLFADRVRVSGARVLLGLSAERVSDEGEGVDVLLSDGRRGRYDLVIAADGVASRRRAELFPDVPAPAPTGQGCWRMIAARPADATRVEIYDAPTQVGLVPCSPDQMYLWALENDVGRDWVDPSGYADRLDALLAGIGGRIPAMKAGIDEHSSIIYRPLDALIVPLPWSAGRVVLIGDAAHATTPHLASGAGMAIEDGIALAEEIERGNDVAESLLAFGRRRFERCRLVVENSVRIGEIATAGGDPAAHAVLIATSTAALALPF